MREPVLRSDLPQRLQKAQVRDIANVIHEGRLAELQVAAIGYVTKRALLETADINAIRRSAERLLPGSRRPDGHDRHGGGRQDDRSHHRHGSAVVNVMTFVFGVLIGVAGSGIGRLIRLAVEARTANAIGRGRIRSQNRDANEQIMTASRQAQARLLDEMRRRQQYRFSQPTQTRAPGPDQTRRRQSDAL